MSGVLDPDATGTYERIADFNGQPAFKLIGQEWYLWFNIAGDVLILSNELGAGTGLEDPYWINQAPPVGNTWTLFETDGSTGTATVIMP